MSLKLNNVRVVLEQPGSDDTLELIVVTGNRDRVRFDLARVRKGWPASNEAPMLWATVCAYFAVQRSGQFPDLTLDEFLDRALVVEMVNPDGTSLTRAQIDAHESGAVDVDPTKPDHQSGY